MKGTPEEETGKGVLNKYNTLKVIHEKVSPHLYLEIGVHKGRSLDLASCTAIGVDPAPQTVAKQNQTIHNTTSDEFFKQKLKIRPDLVLIDGLHLFEFALRDFINSEKICHKKSVIVIDDIFPAHSAQATRERRTQKWAGDVWKVYAILKKYRTDLSLDPLKDVYPTGLLVIKNIDPSNNYLLKHYPEIIAEYENKPVPKYILNRK